MTTLIMGLVDGAIVLGIGLTVALFLRRGSASLRHAVLVGDRVRAAHAGVRAAAAAGAGHRMERRRVVVIRRDTEFRRSHVVVHSRGFVRTAPSRETPGGCGSSPCGSPARS